MNKLILDIYHRDFAALDAPFKADAKENLALSQMEDLENQLRVKLAAEDHALLSQYHNACMKAMDAVAEADFLEGYRMGIQLMIAAWPKG